MSDVKMTDEQFSQFKTLFSMFIVQQYNACSTFVTALNRCQSTRDIDRLLKVYDDEILDHLGIEAVDEDELEDAQSELESAKGDIADLEHEIKRYKGRTLDSVMKLEAFVKHKENYFAHDLEYLLENGLALIKQKRTA